MAPRLIGYLIFDTGDISPLVGDGHRLCNMGLGRMATTSKAVKTEEPAA
jgi:hypothetical protein